MSDGPETEEPALSWRAPGVEPAASTPIPPAPVSSSERVAEPVSDPSSPAPVPVPASALVLDEPPPAVLPPPPQPPAPPGPSAPVGPLPVPGPAPTAVPRWRSLRGLRAAISALGAVTCLSLVACVVAYAHRYSVVDDVLHGGGVSPFSRLDDADDYVSAAAIVAGLCSFALFVLLVVWTWRAAKNQQALGRANPRFGPGWAIGAWFVPLANLVLPLLVVQDLWRGSDASVARERPDWRAAKGSALVGWWWAIGIVSLVRLYDEGDDRSVTLAQFQDGDTVRAIGTVVAVVATLLLVLVVRSITQRQEDTLRAQHEAWNPGH
jgi:hypothetical protein